jgi:hypothetical protein
VTSLRDFIAARLDEDFDVATAAGSGRWVHEGHGRVGDDSADDYNDYVIVYDEGAPTEAQADHIARHDPARVLREVAAKRRVLARHCTPEADDYRAKYGGELGCVGCGDWESGSADIVWNVEYIENCPELRDLAAPFSDHPDFDPNWSTT